MQKVNELFIYTDKKDWGRVQKVFDDKVNFDMTSLVGGKPLSLSPKEITDGWDKGLSKIPVVHHQLGNYLITLDKNTATVFCYGTAVHYLQNPSGNNTRTFVGSYDIHLVKKGEWVIDSFKYNSKFVEGNLTLGSE